MEVPCRGENELPFFGRLLPQSGKTFPNRGGARSLFPPGCDRIEMILQNLYSKRENPVPNSRYQTEHKYQLLSAKNRCPGGDESG
jgi:hypothetical protein